MCCESAGEFSCEYRYQTIHTVISEWDPVFSDPKHGDYLYTVTDQKLRATWIRTYTHKHDWHRTIERSELNDWDRSEERDVCILRDEAACSHLQCNRRLYISQYSHAAVIVGSRFLSQSLAGVQRCCAAASSLPPPHLCYPAADHTCTSPRCQSYPAHIHTHTFTWR